MRRILILAMLSLLTVIGCSATSGPGSVRGESSAHGNAEATTSAHCGIERWPVKVGTDAQAPAIAIDSPVPTTISQMTSFTPPSSLPQNSRVAPVETHDFQVSGILTQYKIEDDQDVHLVIYSGKDHMIAEIPSPSCAVGSTWLSLITLARTQFDKNFAPSTAWKHVSIPVTITGVGFFDDIHGQTGVAANGIELHPVIDLTSP